MTREECKLWRRECIKAGVIITALFAVFLGFPNWIG